MSTRHLSLLLAGAFALGLVLAPRPAAARAAPLAPGPIATVVETVPDEPEVRIRVGSHRAEWENLRGGPNAPVMTERGVLFRLRARGAESVAVAGSFEGWEPLPMRRCRNGVWRLPIDVPPGDHAYAFLVDGLWIHDPDNPALASHEQHPDAPLEAPSRVRVQHDDVVVPRGWAARDVSFGFRATYDRVDQAGVYGSLHYHDRARLHPEITLLAGYAFGREQGLYDIDFAQPLLGPRALDLGGSVYRRTDTRDAHRIGATENSIAALVARQDWRDWFEAEGLELSATAYLGLLGTLTAGYGREEHRSLEKTTDWGILFPNRDMRENPAVDAGRFRSVRLAFERDSRNHERNPERGGLLRASWESFGGDAGGDYDFRRATAEIRRYVTVSPGYWIDFRLAGGRIDDAFRGDGDSRVAGFDAIPLQERFYLGGIGTMRATRFKSLRGDRLLLANVEARVEIVRNLQLAVFTDIGDAWVDAERDRDLKVDGGIGVQNADANLRLDLARRLDDRDPAVILSGRIQRMF